MKLSDNVRPSGVSVHWLIEGLLVEVKDAGFDQAAPIYKLEDLSDPKCGVIRRKGKDIVCPRDGKIGAAYVDCLKGEDNVGPANIMLSYGWGNAIGDIVDTLVDFCKCNHLEIKRTYIWICCLCNNQHRVAENKKSGIEVEFEEFRDIFGSCVTGIGNVIAMMSPWNKPIYLTRVWCIFELYTASVNKDCQVSIVMPPSDKENMVESIKNIDVLYEVLASTKVQDAKASESSDRERILALIEEGAGIYSLNNQVNNLLRQWVKDAVIEAVQSYEADAGDVSSDANFANLCLEVGFIIQENGESCDAIILHRKALKIRQHVFGKNHPSTAICHNNLGIALENIGDYDLALVELRRGLDILKLGADNSDTATSYYGIGFVLEKKGEYDQALENYDKSLNLRKEVLHENHPDTAKCYNSMGTVFRGIGKNDQALVMYEKALAIRKEGLSNDHPDTATSHNHIGKLLGEIGKFSEALVVLRRGLTIREKVLGSDHRDTATSHHNIGVVLSRKGNLSEALVELRIGLNIRLNVLGYDRRATADSYDSIGVALGMQENYLEALVELNKGLAIRKKVLRTNHPVIVISKQNIDDLLLAQKKANKCSPSSLSIFSSCFKH